MEPSFRSRYTHRIWNSIGKRLLCITCLLFAFFLAFFAAEICRIPNIRSGTPTNPSRSPPHYKHLLLPPASYTPQAKFSRPQAALVHEKTRKPKLSSKPSLGCSNGRAHFRPRHQSLDLPRRRRQFIRMQQSTPESGSLCRHS